MRGTIIESWYDTADDFLDIDGNLIHTQPTANVIKETKYGTFYGRAVACEEDEDIANSWDGFRFAEMKCDIKAYKAKAKMLRERAKGIKHAMDVIAFSDAELMFSECYEKLERQYNVALNEYDKAVDYYISLEEVYPAYCSQIIKQRREFRDKRYKE